MKILFGYHYYPYPVDVRDQTEALMRRLRDAGFDVEAFPLTLRPPGPKVNWPYLDTCWKRGDRELLAMYESLGNALAGRDVFLNYGGLNLHPAFLDQIDAFKVMVHFDDPENSATVSRPVAHAYDLCLVCNPAEVERYGEWGARAAEYLPLGYRLEDADPLLTEEMILTQDRDVDVTLLCSRELVHRRSRLDAISEAFPEGRFHGLGWSSGFLAEDERVPLLRRTRVGINVHHSTGPINVRLFALPANGVMQICDCRSHLGQVFEIGTEVVAYESTGEAIELARHYLEHEDERRAIAAAGYRRTIRDYNEIAVFRRLVERVEFHRSKSVAQASGPLLEVLDRRRSDTWFSSIQHEMEAKIRRVYLNARRCAAALKNAVFRIGS